MVERRLEQAAEVVEQRQEQVAEDARSRPACLLQAGESWNPVVYTIHSREAGMTILNTSFQPTR